MARRTAVALLLGMALTSHASSRLPATLAAAAVEVRQAAEPTRQAFAQLALTHLIEQYRKEVARARGRASGWQRGAGGYVAQLESLRARLEAGAPVRFAADTRRGVRLMVGDAQVMLHAPRDAAQGAFEAAVIADWCAMTECAVGAVPEVTLAAAANTVTNANGPADSANPVPLEASVLPRPQPLTVTPVAAVPGPTPVVAARAAAMVPRKVPGTWQLDEGRSPTYASEDGLQCVYPDTRHLKLKQAACDAVLRDLRRLVGGLKAAQSRGTRIDWAALRVGPNGLDKPAHVALGPDGKTVDVELPMLCAAPELLPPLMPWLQARVRGDASVAEIPVPDGLSYLAP